MVEIKQCASPILGREQDILIVSATITRQLHAAISNEIEKKKSNTGCTVFLTTYGGDPDGGYRIGRCLRHHYQYVRVVVPSMCKSAGTLIAIAADELGIGDLGELGPLDMQISKPSELLENGSGLDIQHALGMILEQAQQAFRATLIDIRQGGRLSTRLAGEFASKIAVGLMEPLYAQLDPIRFAESQRAMQITHEYGKRLNKYANNLTDEGLDLLVAGYPSHGFVIDRKEAKTLFQRVGPMTSVEEFIGVKYQDVLGSVTETPPFLLQLGALNQGENCGSNVTSEEGPAKVSTETCETEREADGGTKDPDEESA